MSSSRSPGSRPGRCGRSYRGLAATSRHRLAIAAKSFTARGIPVRTEALVGEPAREIIRLAQARRADLVVMGSHKVKAVRGGSRGWGTTSYKVGIFCQCPILLVK